MNNEKLLAEAELLDMHLTRPLLVFDLETTDKDPKTCRTVQFCGVVLYPEQPAVLHVGLINPLCEVAPEAQKVHGITTEKARSGVIMGTFLQYTGLSIVLQNCDVAGYNVMSFDWPILKREAEEAGVRVCQDVQQLDAFRFFKKEMNHKLESAFLYHTGDPMQNAHDAAADVFALLSVMNRQVTKYGLHTVDQYIEKYHDANAVDPDGKLIKKDGVVCVNFGKHKGVPLKEVPYSYIAWMRKNAVVAAEYLDAI